MTKELQKQPEKVKKLNEKQQAFVENMITRSMSARDAYMAVYKVDSKTTASTNAYRLLQNPLIKAELSSLSNQVKALSHMPKHLVMGELKEFIATLKQDLDNPSNRKYYMEALDMINKLEGYYNHDKVVTKVNIDGNISFGDWNPDTQPNSSYTLLREPEDIQEVLPGDIQPDIQVETNTTDNLLKDSEDDDRWEILDEDDIKNGISDSESDMPF